MKRKETYDVMKMNGYRVAPEKASEKKWHQQYNRNTNT